MITNCTQDPRDVEWVDAEYASYLNPFALLWLYYCLVLISKELCKEKVRAFLFCFVYTNRTKQNVTFRECCVCVPETFWRCDLWLSSNLQPARKQGAFSRLEGSFNGPLTRQLSSRLSERRLMRSSTTRNRWQSATRKVRVSKTVSLSLYISLSLASCLLLRFFHILL